MLGNVNKITTTYTAVNDKVDNSSTLSAAEWNTISNAVATAHTKINAIIDEAGTGSSNSESPVTTTVDSQDSSKTIVRVGGSLVGELTVKSKGTNVTLAGTNNINIEPRASLGTGESKSGENMKGGNIAFKPGDDIEIWAHHRGSSKSDKAVIKALTERQSDNEEIPAKLEINTGDIILTSEDKITDNNITNIDVKGNSGKGYLKVRAQAIDLRCEDHGGVALQPKGFDNDPSNGYIYTTMYNDNTQSGTWEAVAGISLDIYHLGLHILNKDEHYVLRIHVEGTAPNAYFALYGASQANPSSSTQLSTIKWNPSQEQLDSNGNFVIDLVEAKTTSNGNTSIQEEILSNGYHYLLFAAVPEENGNAAGTQPDFASGSYMVLEKATIIQGGMNKIKFEHGGGDGLEFGTFNTEKSSLFTKEYRFNKDGVVKVANRRKIYSDKGNIVTFEYVGQSDTEDTNNAVYGYAENGEYVISVTAIPTGTLHVSDIVTRTGVDKDKFLEWVTYNLSSGDTFQIVQYNASNQITKYHSFTVTIDTGDDSTIAYKYIKSSDDFYDIIDNGDPTCTWGDIVSIIAELKTMKANNQGPWSTPA